MSQLDPLMAAVIAAPEELAPRRAFAAAVKATDPDRARLIELQLALRERRRAGQELGPEDTVPPRELVQRHGRRWAGKLADQVDYFMFWGGFVEEIELSAAKLVAAGSALVKLAPLRHLRVRALAGQVGDVADLPILAQARSLDVASCNLADVDIAELVRSPKLRGIRLLRITNNPVGLDAMRAIARADLPELRFVDATQTDAPLVIRTSDWDGSIPEVSWTRARATLVTEFGHLRWLDARDEPSPDVI